MTDPIPLPSEQTLPDPGLPIFLTVSSRTDGKSDVNYICSPGQAVSVLRELADSIESEIDLETDDAGEIR